VSAAKLLRAGTEQDPAGILETEPGIKLFFLLAVDDKRKPVTAVVVDQSVFQERADRKLLLGRVAYALLC
jgi:hypothetical protein